MRRRVHLSVLPLALAAFAAPAAASTTGGAAPNTGLASATSGSTTLTTKTGALIGVRKVFSGTVSARDAGRPVAVQRFDDLTGQWSEIARATAQRNGSFAVRWKPDARVGPQRVRAIVDRSTATAASAEAPEVGITVFRPGKATYYGPGFYGNETACGGKLTKTTLGVAHRTLPCGTPVTILYKGVTVTVPVIDRGPFANGANWDLTAATAQAVNMTGTSRIGTLADTN